MHWARASLKVIIALVFPPSASELHEEAGPLGVILESSAAVWTADPVVAEAGVGAGGDARWTISGGGSRCRMASPTATTVNLAVPSRLLKVGRAEEVGGTGWPPAAVTFASGIVPWLLVPAPLNLSRSGGHGSRVLFAVAGTRNPERTAHALSLAHHCLHSQAKTPA